MNAIIPIDKCSPIAYEDVFEEGDRWEKIKGCEDCPIEYRLKCCGYRGDDNHCRMLVIGSGECKLHDDRNRDKPLYCVIGPTPDMCKKNCCLEFECVKGSNKGKIRKVCDVGGVIKKPPLSASLTDGVSVKGR